jgi:hypothetical protein
MNNYGDNTDSKGECHRLAAENNLMRHLVYIMRLMRECDAVAPPNEEDSASIASAREMIKVIRREQILIGQIYVKFLAGSSKQLQRHCSEDVIKQWQEYVEQSADFWQRWQWRFNGRFDYV